MLQKTIQKRIATFALSAALLLSAMPPALAAGERIHYLANEDLAPGVHYTEEDINGYGETGDRRVRINHLSIDPSADGLTFRSARAEDTINAMENVKNQALRDVYQGVNVVAAINADSYNKYGCRCQQRHPGARGRHCNQPAQQWIYDYNSGFLY